VTPWAKEWFERELVTVGFKVRMMPLFLSSALWRSTAMSSSEEESQKYVLTSSVFLLKYATTLKNKSPSSSSSPRMGSRRERPSGPRCFKLSTGTWMSLKSNRRTAAIQVVDGRIRLDVGVTDHATHVLRVHLYDAPRCAYGGFEGREINPKLKLGLRITTRAHSRRWSQMRGRGRA